MHGTDGRSVDDHSERHRRFIAQSLEDLKAEFRSRGGDLLELQGDAVAALAERLRGRHPVIHVLANNAGALFLDRETTADGVERTLALNHLAYVQLTLALLDPLLAAARPGAPARVLCVSSRAHENARVDVDDLSLARGYGGWRAYANSKLCNIWFAQGLAQRLDPSLVVAHSLHPGVVRTRFA